MNKTGPIIVIEDDADDRHMLEMVFKDLNYPNEIKFFGDGEAALEYLGTDSVYPFIILSDINLPKLDGFSLRQMVHTNDELSKKCIPYLFFSTSVNEKAVFDAYTMSVQGFFLKPDTYTKLVDTIRTMVEYWKLCYSPNSYN